MTTNERTSKRVARIAAKVLALEPYWPHPRIFLEVCAGDGEYHAVYFKWPDIQALAASALTQSPDKPKRKAIALTKKQSKALDKALRSSVRVVHKVKKRKARP